MNILGKKSRKRQVRTVFVIKHPEEVYLIRSSFFKRRLLPSLDRNVARSNMPLLVLKVAQAFIEPSQLTVKHGAEPQPIENVEVNKGEQKIDLQLVIIHAELDHKIKVIDPCTLLSDHPTLDALLRKRIKGTKLMQAA